MYACMYVCNVCMHACMYGCVYVCMRVCMYVCMYVCVCMYVSNVCMYVSNVCMYVCNIMKCHQDASGSFAGQIWMPRCDASYSEEIPVEEAKAAETVEPRQWCTHGKHTVWSEYTCVHLIIIICDANIRKFYSCMRKVEPCNSNLIWPHDTSRLSCRRSEILFGSSLSLSLYLFSLVAP